MIHQVIFAEIKSNGEFKLISDRMDKNKKKIKC